MSASRKVSALVRADGAVDFPGDLGVETNFLTGDVLQSRRIGLRRGALLRVRAVRGVLDNGGGIRRRKRQLTGGKRRRGRSRHAGFKVDVNAVRLDCVNERIVAAKSLH